MNGTILRVVCERGFGFILPQGERRTVFFHATDLIGLEFGEQLRELQVSFELIETEKGLQARCVEAY